MTTPKVLLTLIALSVWQAAPASARDWSLRRDLRVGGDVAASTRAPRFELERKSPRPAAVSRAFNRATRLAGMFMGRVDVGSIGVMRVKLNLDLK